MKIIQVNFRRVFNLGNYQTATVELVAAVDEDEDAKQVLNQLVDEALAWRKARAGGAI